MADIEVYLEKIQEAVYGEEVRGSIHDAIQAVNESAEGSALSAELNAEKAETHAKKAEQSSVKAQVAADEAESSEENAEKYALNAKSYAVGTFGQVRSEDTEDNAKKYSEKAKSEADTAKEYLTKVEKAGEDAVQAVQEALDMDAPSFTVDLETGHLMYDGGRFVFNVNSNGHLEWGLAV